MTGRIPPHDRDAEASLVGAALITPQAIDGAAPHLTADDFYVPALGHAWAAAITLRDAEQPVDPVTVAAQLAAAGHTALTAADLTALTADTPATGNAARYARIIAGHANRRRLIRLAADIIDAGYDTSTDLDVTLDRAAADLDQLTAARSGAARPVPLGDALADWLDAEHTWHATGGTTGPAVTTGLADLDHKLAGGWRPGQLIVVAARPALGKSTFVAQAGLAAAEAGHPTLIVSLEMGVAEIAQRYVGSTGRVDLQRVRTHSMHDDDWAAAERTVRRHAATPLHILDDASASLASIRAAARQMRGLGLLIVDYLALVRPPAGQRREGRQFEVAEIARGLKQLARDLNMPVVAAAQINRQVEQHISDRRPTLASLRDSGEVEAAADVVIGLYRDDYYNPESADRGIAELIVLKQRNGPTGTVKVAWLAHHGRFDLMAKGA